MKILTWDTNNFGDRLNEWIWPEYIGELIDDDSTNLLVGIGSLLNHRLPISPVKHIFGSGIGHGELPSLDEKWKINWVRGPLSAKQLNLSDQQIITDAAILIGDLITPSKIKLYDHSFIPHCSAITPGTRELLVNACLKANIHFIDPTWPHIEVIEHINQSKHLLTEALHGAITADTLRVPWYPLTRRGILEFKWLDWAMSMNLIYKPSLLFYRTQWFSTNKRQKISRKALLPIVRPIVRPVLYQQLKYFRNNSVWHMSDSKTHSDKIKIMKQRLKEVV